MGRIGTLIGTEYTNSRGLVYIKHKYGSSWRQCWKPKQRYVIEKQLERDLLPEERVLRVRGNKNEFELYMFQLINYKTGEILRFISDEGHYYTKIVSRKWSNQYESCLKCAKTTFKYTARGLCSRCYRRDLDKIRKRLRSKSRLQTFPQSHKLI